ncbi:MAG: YdcF family protein, partial [Anaerolineae bacterium]
FAILIMGKRQGTKPKNHQLRGRVAMGAALWHSLDHEKPPIFFLAADTHGPFHTDYDGTVVKELLTQRYHIPADYVSLRRWSKCTLVEVLGMRVLARSRGIRRVLAVTHPYHLRRARAYFAQAGLKAQVLPAEVSALRQLPFPPELADLKPAIEQAVIRAQPSPLDLARERFVEGCLSILHEFDPRGRVERRLAKLLRR